ncbi:hypothetical protein [Flavobacterium sp.]|uniref:hypothetical protein n=1 Tax=Flavobacterium sp. TaxID=239 RepID=UPI0025C49BAA|nr:hypothetical protein [Flavobacterium sp.]MBA4154306.1 hypothetical protein [Flavobacterium sp.]
MSPKSSINFIIILLSLLSSCKSINSDDYYKDCVNNKTQKILYDGHGIKKDIFSILKETEQLLLDEKIIHDFKKESYLKLTVIAFHNNEESKKIATKIRTKINDNFFDLLSLTTLDFYSSCPEEVYNKEISDAKKNILRKRYTIYSYLMADGYKNEIRIASLINQSEKFSEIERLVILHLILMNISN